MDKITEQLITWIKDGLKRTGKNQTGLAAHLGIAHPQITQLLKGVRAIKASELPKIAAFIESESPLRLDGLTPGNDATRLLANLTEKQIEEVVSFVAFIKARDRIL